MGGKMWIQWKNCGLKKKMNSATNHAVNVQLKRNRKNWSFIYSFLLFRFITKNHDIAFELERSSDVFVLAEQLN